MSWRKVLVSGTRTCRCCLFCSIEKLLLLQIVRYRGAYIPELDEDYSLARILGRAPGGGGRVRRAAPAERATSRFVCLCVKLRFTVQYRRTTRLVRRAQRYGKRMATAHGPRRAQGRHETADSRLVHIIASCKFGPPSQVLLREFGALKRRVPCSCSPTVALAPPPCVPGR